MTTSDLWDEDTAEHYDDLSAGMFAPDGRSGASATRLSTWRRVAGSWSRWGWGCRASAGSRPAQVGVPFYDFSNFRQSTVEL